MLPTTGASSTVAAGTVTLLTDAPQSEAMLLGGISRSFEPPATLRLTQDAWRFTFPVSGGHLDPGTGTAGARGGLVLWGRETMSAWLQLSFTKLTVTTGATCWPLWTCRERPSRPPPLAATIGSPRLGCRRSRPSGSGTS